MSSGSGKIMTASEAVKLIKNGDTVAISGFFGSGFAEEIAKAVESQFLETGEPKDLSLFYAAGMGDFADRGGNRFGYEGLVRKAIGAHWGTVPKLGKLAMDNKIEAYCLPQGVICHMYRDIAAHKPRTITTVGIGTFVDPRIEGGIINSKTTEQLVEVINFDGKEYLAYKNEPLDVAILRGTTSDMSGNITMEKEALTLEMLSMAMAVRNSGGTIIVQVERLAQTGTLHPKHVTIPGILVDAVVVAKPENHVQTYGADYNPSFSGELRVPMDMIPPMEMSERKIMARRAAFELRKDQVVNLGMGVPESIAVVANEEGILDMLTLTTEPGVIGGLPEGSWNFGAGTNTNAIIDQPYQFDFYHGGGLDVGFLGQAQTDSEGNVNVSKFGSKLIGGGGFIDITQNAKEVVFLGAFTANGLEIAIEDGQLKILNEGKIRKFIQDVEQITFSGSFARKIDQPVIYVTERCVFKITKEGMTLIEIAPGVDLERDILEHMDFKPIISPDLKLMDERIFSPEPMNLKEGF